MFQGETDGWAAESAGATIQNENNTDRVGAWSLYVGQRSLDVSKKSSFDWRCGVGIQTGLCLHNTFWFGTCGWIYDEKQFRLNHLVTTTLADHKRLKSFYFTP